jgi:hypothetical protein
MSETGSALALDPWAQALWRMRSFGSDSQARGRLVEYLLTTVAPCKQHGRSLLHFLVPPGETALQGTALEVCRPR